MLIPIIIVVVVIIQLIQELITHYAHMWQQPWSVYEHALLHKHKLYDVRNNNKVNKLEEKTVVQIMLLLIILVVLAVMIIVLESPH